MDPAAGAFPVGPGHAPLGAVRCNGLLDCLSTQDLARVIAAGQPSSFSAEEVVVRSGDPIRQVYFPISGYASVIVSGCEDSSVQIALAGTESMLGWECLLGANEFLFHASALEPFDVLAIDVGLFLQRAVRTKGWRRSLYAYIRDLFQAIARSSLCARFHLLEARLARCLLEIEDRHDDSPILLTQKTLSQLLGVRRSGVTNAATHLQLHGLIQYRRGEIRILDRAGLQAAACECYRPHDHD